MEKDQSSGKTIHYVTRSFQLILSTTLVLVALLLCYLLFYEIYVLVILAFHNPNVHDVLQEVLSFFLYFGFASMCVKYFRENYHFPLRYLLYIGITATIRFLIVNRDDVTQNVLLAVVVLILILCYVILFRFKISR